MGRKSNPLTLVRKGIIRPKTSLKISTVETVTLARQKRDQKALRESCRAALFASVGRTAASRCP
ncbi:hypothetical protein BOTBODRAFT_383185 [Botryobasidium botryosum FD-172 SS1]|uniref:Uncharacterized protein n=1 Tax=Botryobasidium botryosum (strain FD-172 SS1) TaxID=930990 RepID=A0A067MZ54_BOTB1|nr:hypothetical protein BOTBODRAFT_383185 [Botryobasidium botryosum FD-172 SS1]